MGLKKIETFTAVCDWCGEEKEYNQDKHTSVPDVQRELPDWQTRGLGYETSRGHANLILCPACKTLKELCEAGKETPKGIRFPGVGL